jgi:penicillin-binding protein 1A
MGIRTPVSSNYAMTLGGLHRGVTALDMAHAYETFIEHGRRVGGTLGASDGRPGGDRMGQVARRQDPRAQRNPPDTGAPARHRRPDGRDHDHGHHRGHRGAGPRSDLPSSPPARPGRPRTAATRGSSASTTLDGRRVGRLRDKLKPMLTEFAGAPVEGGTYPRSSGTTS